MLPEKSNKPLAICQIISIIMLIILFHHILVSADTVKKDKSLENTSEQIITEATTHTEYEDPFKISLNPKRNYLILVNGQNEFEFGGKFDRALQKDLIYVSNVYGEPIQVEKGAYLAFSLLRSYLREEKGIDIDLYSCYRTQKEQQWFCDQSVGFDPEIPIDNPVDMPGHSERHTGLLLHIKVRQPVGETKTYIWMSEFLKDQSENEDFEIIHESLARFGFIMRYPDGKEGVTGSPYRPYEIRFVGSSEDAKIIVNNKLCLEEYLADYEKYHK